MQTLARELRNRPSPYEAMLWKHLSGSKLDGLKFRRQVAIEGCVADFLCPERGLIVEIDGETHDAEADAARDKRLYRLGFVTLRFSNLEVRENVEGVLAGILRTAMRQPARFARPTPTPPAEQEGL